MSTEIEIPDQNDSEADEAALATLEADEATVDIDASPEGVAVNDDTEDSPEDGANPIDLDEASDKDDGEEVDTSMGEWSLCASMIFLAGYLVVVMFWALGHPVWETLVSFETQVYRSEFPVGVATILLLISVLSAFCSFISLVADKNNRRTMLIRLLTLGPFLPTAASTFMIWVIIQRGAGNSILENFLG